MSARPAARGAGAEGRAAGGRAPLGRALARRAAAALALALATAAPAATAGLSETFAEANEAFWGGDHEAAARGYEELVALGVRDPDVFYNLGTAYGRLGRFGPAILNLERSLRLEPGHGDARENLLELRRALARSRTSGGEDADLQPPRSFWMNLLGRLSANQLGLAFLVCWLGLFAVLSVRRLVRRELVRLVLLVVAPLLVAAALVTGALFASKAYYDAAVQEAVAIDPGRSVVREGPADRFRRLYEVREGDRVRVLDEERGWLHVRDPQGREGWASTDDFGLVRLPSR